jgi:hypothetical protein
MSAAAVAGACGGRTTGAAGDAGNDVRSGSTDAGGDVLAADCAPGLSCSGNGVCVWGDDAGDSLQLDCVSGRLCFFGQNPPSPVPGECPATTPPPGSACTAGVPCTYLCSDGGRSDSVCNWGVWCGGTDLSCTASYAAACPSIPPVIGSPCSSQQGPCFYDRSSCVVEISCVGSTWNVSLDRCPDAGVDSEAGVTDAATTDSGSSD